MRATLIAVELLSASIWVGGLVAIAVVAQCAREQLGPRARIFFFRSLGRRYLRIGVGSLTMAYAAGAVLIGTAGWSTIESALVIVAAALLVVTAAGVAQARSLSRLRTAALAGGPLQSHRHITRHARRAGALRGMIAALTVALVVLAAVRAS